MDDYWPVAIGNIQKECQRWACLSWIMGWEGADAQALGRFYLDIVQTILIVGAEIWVVTLHIRRVLGGFHHRVELLIKGKQPRK